jgi:hypothetical protein
MELFCKALPTSFEQLGRFFTLRTFFTIMNTSMIIRKYLYELLGCDGMFVEEVLSKSNLSCSQINLPFLTPHSAQEE